MSLRLHVLAAALCVLMLPTMAEAAQCTICGKGISGRFLTAKGKTFCSQTCYSSTLPKCASCGKRVSGRHIVSNDKPYCSDRCFKTVLPPCGLCGKRVDRTLNINGNTYCQDCGNSTRCSTCRLPFLSGFKLNDGRRLCKPCNADAIYEVTDARTGYMQARRDLKAITGKITPIVPELQLVGSGDLRQRLAHHGIKMTPGMTMHGFYDRTEDTVEIRNLLGRVTDTRTDVTKTVFILYGLSQEAFRTTAVHELTHDWLAEFLPKIENAPLWVQEGLCQYTASEMCRKYDMKMSLRTIERAKDGVYGDGYRYFSRKFGPNAWPAIWQWLQKTDLNRLPAKAPKDG
jgi:endogenous inhibitor of DNA gyrase (YacG/DUF329 family)